MKKLRFICSWMTVDLMILTSVQAYESITFNLLAPDIACYSRMECLCFHLEGSQIDRKQDAWSACAFISCFMYGVRMFRSGRLSIFKLELLDKRLKNHGTEVYKLGHLKIFIQVISVYDEKREMLEGEGEKRSGFVDYSTHKFPPLWRR